MLYIIASYCMHFQGEPMNQIWENGKNLVLGPILVHLAQIRAAILFIIISVVFFSKNLVPPVTRYGQLSSFTISEKTDDLVLRKLSDG